MPSSQLSRYGLDILATLDQALTGKVPEPMSILLIQDFGRDPYLILIACLLSLRSRDLVTYQVCKELFARVKTPQQMVGMPQEALEHILHKIGFFRRKAVIVKQVSQQLIDEYHSQVPETEAGLLSLKGVGRKTANLVLVEAFNKPAICVDVHVHRLSNLFGLVHTTTPEQTELALQKIFPRSQWRNINRLFVMLGQNSCSPTAKKCSFCLFFDHQKIHLRLGIKTH